MRFRLQSLIRPVTLITMTTTADLRKSKMIRTLARRSEVRKSLLKAIRPFIWVSRSGGVKSRVSWIPLLKSTALKESR